MTEKQLEGAIIALWKDGTPSPHKVGIVEKIGKGTQLYKLAWVKSSKHISVYLTEEEMIHWTEANPSYRKILCYGNEEHKILEMKLKHPEYFS